MIRVRHLFALGTLLFFSAGCPDFVHAASLSSIVSSNGTIQQGDKLFSHFSFDPKVNFGTSGPGSFGPASAGDIDVQGITVGGQNGLQFTGPFLENSTPTAQSFLFYHIQYDVTVTNPGFLISDLHQSFSGTATGTNFANIETWVSTDSCTNAPGDVCSFGGPPSFSVNASGPLASNVSSAHVNEGFSFSPIIGSGGDPTGSVSVASISVTFSQQAAPETSTWVPFVIGLVVLALWRKRERIGTLDN
jgi:hypothetical protein